LIQSFIEAGPSNASVFHQKLRESLEPLSIRILNLPISGIISSQAPQDWPPATADDSLTVQDIFYEHYGLLVRHHRFAIDSGSEHGEPLFPYICPHAGCSFPIHEREDYIDHFHAE
jgi:hypothetical protein